MEAVVASTSMNTDHGNVFRKASMRLESTRHCSIIEHLRTNHTVSDQSDKQGQGQGFQCMHVHAWLQGVVNSRLQSAKVGRDIESACKRRYVESRARTTQLCCEDIKAVASAFAQA